jgi:isopentenyl-diphosphate Delta-isomerase
MEQESWTSTPVNCIIAGNMGAEITEILNADGDIIGTMTREEAEQNNHIIQNVIVFVFNSQGKVWIQKRPIAKKHYPGLWDVSACGAMHAGEDKRKAAEREQAEEMGFVSELHFVETFMNEFPDETGKETRVRLSHLFVGISDEQPHNTEEVDEFRALSYDELSERVKAKPEDYIPSFKVELDKAIDAYKKIVK